MLSPLIWQSLCCSSLSPIISWREVETHRLTRAQFAPWFDNRSVELVVMEACGSAHHWARTLMAQAFSACFVGHQRSTALVLGDSFRRAGTDHAPLTHDELSARDERRIVARSHPDFVGLHRALEVFPLGMQIGFGGGFVNVTDRVLRRWV